MEDQLHPLLQDSLELKSMNPGLERMETLDAALGYPSRQFACVQVAGTNGKGSVTTKIATALQVNGKKVGLYTSPHISSWHERIQINGVPIAEEKGVFYLNKILNLSDARLSYFELLTLIAFCHFSEEKVDVAVLETGLGGRLDATNIVQPILSVITSIDFDHMAYLGNTLEAIAFEKAGIIKAGVPALIGPRAKPRHVFEEVAEKTQSPLFQVKGSFEHYEEENQAIARKALRLLPFPLERSAIVSGLAAVPPCRFEVISQDPVIILDVAHNPDGIRRTFERLKFCYPNQRIRVLAGFSKDKAIAESLGIIQKYADEVHFTYTDHYRLSREGEPIESAFEKAYAAAKQNGEVLLVCGTFFIMHQARLLARSMWEKGGDLATRDDKSGSVCPEFAGNPQ